MVGLRGSEGREAGAVFGSRVQPWESQVDAQTEAATSRRHDWGRAGSFRACGCHITVL